MYLNKNNFILTFSNDEYGSENGNEQGSEEEETIHGRKRVEESSEDTENETGTESNNQQYDSTEGENQYIDEQLDDEIAATTLETETTTGFIG